MDKRAPDPKTLQAAIVYFSDPDRCRAYLAAKRWPRGVVCPMCGAKDPCFLEARGVWQCKRVHAKRQFSVKVGTIFEDSPLPLEKWLPAVWLIANCKNGISSYEIARALGVTQKTAWFMLHRVRLAMQNKSLAKLRGRVEADETFIGGKVRNMHVTKRRRVMGSKRGGTYSKAIVMAMLERNTGRVRAHIIDSVEGSQVQSVIRHNVEPGAEIITDAWRGYRGLSRDFLHNFVNHMREYVNGHVHTNGIENFWSLLKRAIKGTYVNVEPFHLHRYVEEQAYRYNERFGKDADRFSKALRQVLGRRLTYADLTTQGSPA